MHSRVGSNLYGIAAATGIALLCTLSARAEQWVQVDSGTPPPLYVDISRLTSHEARARAWVKTEIAGGLIELRWLFEFNCANGTYRTIESITRTGTEVQTQRNDERDPFSAIGSKSGYVPAYVYACKATVGRVAPPSDERTALEVPTLSAEGEHWRRFKAETDGSQYFIDTKTLRVSGHYVLAWLKTTSPAIDTVFVLQEYDCKNGMHRAHAVNASRFDQPGGWTHPSATLLSAFAPICKSLSSSRPDAQRSEPVPSKGAAKARRTDI